MQRYADLSIFWQTPKHFCKLIKVSRQNTKNYFRCHFYSSLHIDTKLIHTKCPTLLKGTSKNAVIRGPMQSTVKEHPSFCSLSRHSSVWVSVWSREMGREMSGAAKGSTLRCVWAPEPLVTGHCQVGSAAGPACDLTRNAAALSVVKKLKTLWKKSKCLCRKTQMGPMGYFSCPAWL